ncbi:hypothetical protein [Geopseudomonas aromaticivorans]
MKRNSPQGHRAPAGGTVAQNGEFYPGGTFLPNTAQPKRPSAPSQRGGRGVLIEPGVFAHKPSDAAHSILACFGEFVHVVQGVPMLVNRPDVAVQAYVDDDVERGRQIIAAAAAAYARGERWFLSHEQLLQDNCAPHGDPIPTS